MMQQEISLHKCRKGERLCLAQERLWDHDSNLECLQKQVMVLQVEEAQLIYSTYDIL